jgi:hypothetical protein
VSVSGSGQYAARELQSQGAEATVSGSGSATLWVEETLGVDISGSGNLHYRGQPAVQSDVSGSGSVRPLDD